MNEYVCCSPPTTVSTSTMIGRVWPCHVAKIAAGTGRVRVFLITSPEMRGNVSVAFDMQALLSSARLLAVARSVTETAMAILLQRLHTQSTPTVFVHGCAFASTKQLAGLPFHRGRIV